mgnify:CR=1 FL=1|tara:strand:- start:634 stop:831 length:198 start_codon:yes stop_codon:yes gene_type:complete
MTDQYSDSEVLTRKRTLSGVDLYLKSAFTTELENINAHKGSHTEDVKVVMKYLAKRIKQFEQIGV